MSEEILPRSLYVVSTPIGNLEDITVRATRVLREVDLIAAEDTRITHRLLDHLGITRPLMSFHSFNERKRVPELLDRLKSGESVALVTDAGTPGISDPAFSIVREAINGNIRVVPVPGASAVLAALIASGLPMERFVFEGFLPVKKGRNTRLEGLREETRTIVIYESPHRIVRTVEDIVRVLGDRELAVSRELTKKFEETVRGTASSVLQELKKKTPRGEYVITIHGSEELRRKGTKSCEKERQ
jgi:16S rRNA (cytidine1402-2'-O)-methyltransferase